MPALSPLRPEFLRMLSSLPLPGGEEDLVRSLDTEPVVAVRLNSAKCGALPEEFVAGRNVPWCGQGYILASRPRFAFMPQWHAGAFYVQEPASMILSAVAKELSGRLDAGNLRWLDLCAAPGGKSTAVVDALPENSFVVANELDPRRALVLAENVARWGAPNVAVTRGDTCWVRKLREMFHVVAVDAPCSGEGMMRKEDVARTQWSEGLVRQCASLQREILENAWEALAPGGFLVYSTCTFNMEENEGNVEWLIETYGAESVDLSASLPLTGALASLRPGVHAMRFMPHVTEGEGLFLAVVRKPGDISGIRNPRPSKSSKKRGSSPDCSGWLRDPARFDFLNDEGILRAIPSAHLGLVEAIGGTSARMLATGVTVGAVKGRDIVPSPELALSTALSPSAFPSVGLTLEEALDYLRRGTSGIMEAVSRQGILKPGYVMVTYDGLPLGFAKFLGNRANNLYPAPWRLHI